MKHILKHSLKNNPAVFREKKCTLLCSHRLSREGSSGVLLFSLPLAAEPVDAVVHCLGSINILVVGADGQMHCVVSTVASFSSCHSYCFLQRKPCWLQYVNRIKSSCLSHAGPKGGVVKPVTGHIFKAGCHGMALLILCDILINSYSKKYRCLRASSLVLFAL